MGRQLCRGTVSPEHHNRVHSFVRIDAGEITILHAKSLGSEFQEGLDFFGRPPSVVEKNLAKAGEVAVPVRLVARGSVVRGRDFFQKVPRLRTQAGRFLLGKRRHEHSNARRSLWEGVRKKGATGGSAG
jgi:hypothetical protein